LVGAVAGVLGTGMAAALAWAMARWLLDVPWVWAPDLAVTGVALTVAGTITMGLAGTYRLLGKRPFAVLRGE
jgi:putative ABC transport system permease protein